MKQYDFKNRDNYANFLRDMGECPTGLTLEIIDNNKGYFKENCKWATYKEQSENRRITRDSNGCYKRPPCGVVE